MANYGTEENWHRVTLSMADVIELILEKAGHQIPDNAGVTWKVDRQWQYPADQPAVAADAITFEWVE